MAVLLTLALLMAAEVVALIEVAHQIGVLAAILLLLATSLFGPPLVRRAGFGVWRRARARLDQGEVPGREAIDGLLLLAAGLLLCVPGFITDAIGLLLLLPPVRAVARGIAGRRLLRRTRVVLARSTDLMGPRAGQGARPIGSGPGGGGLGGGLGGTPGSRGYTDVASHPPEGETRSHGPGPAS